MSETFDGPLCVHYQRCDPGAAWGRDPGVAIDAPTSDGGVNVLTPNVVRLPGGGYRMYYTQLDRVQDYNRSRGDIRSAVSPDGRRWEKEPGVRLGPFPPHATQRVLCPDVIPLADGSWRMFVEAKAPGRPSVVLSARSRDGLDWEPELGVRLASEHESYGAPRCLYLAPGSPEACEPVWIFRLYCQRYSYPFRPGPDAHNQIVSALSDDGWVFTREAGTRMSQRGEAESYGNNGPEVIRLGDGGYRMYYAGWQADPVRARVFTATSADGLHWARHSAPCIDVDDDASDPGSRRTVKASEPCVIDLPDGRHRMYFEACDPAGQWRILSATAR